MGSARLKVDTHFWQTNMHKKYQVPTYVVSEHTDYQIHRGKYTRKVS